MVTVITSCYYWVDVHPLHVPVWLKQLGFRLGIKEF